MRKFLSITTLCMIATVIVSFTSCTAQTPKGDLKTNIDSLSYATGVSMTQGLDDYLMQLGISDEYKADFVKGFVEGASTSKNDIKTKAQIMGQQIGLQIGTDNFDRMNAQIFGADSTQSLNKTQLLAGFIESVKKEALMDEMTAQMVSQTESEKLINKKNEVYQVENLAFLEKNKENAGVTVLPSGLQYKVIQEGNGPKPAETDNVIVHYIGTTINGTEFNNTVKEEQPFEFSLAGGVIQGWLEGVQLMSVGSKYIFYIPYDLAYGEGGRPGVIDPYATLIFEIELLEIVK